MHAHAYDNIFPFTGFSQSSTVSNLAVKMMKSGLSLSPLWPQAMRCGRASALLWPDLTSHKHTLSPPSDVRITAAILYSTPLLPGFGSAPVGSRLSLGWFVGHQAGAGPIHTPELS